MREIKFRAWHKRIKKMMYGVEHWGEYNIGRIQSDGSNSEYILMESIGLKDKNGKEIYEGDVWLHTDGLGKKTVEIVKYQSFGFEHNDEGIGYGIQHEPKTKTTSITVVGNIYENPELLDNIKM